MGAKSNPNNETFGGNKVSNENKVEESILEESQQETNVEHDEIKTKDNLLGKGNINDSLEDIFKSLQKTEPNLIEIENMSVEDSLDEHGCKRNEAEKEVKMKDPFDDLFDELDDENLEDVDQGFEQLYANKKNIAEEEKSSSNLDIESNDVITENQSISKVGTILDIEEHPMIANTIGTVIEEEDQDSCIEKDCEVKIEENIE